ncbi:MAG: putative membrane protein YdbT with pleckstrin-like domain [Rhodothermales bacterium]|jgi:uncharacterized membrane protein YdbT with pleckstrin-like domain
MTSRSLKPHRTAFLLNVILFPVILLSTLAIAGGIVGFLYVGGWVASVAGAAWIVLVGVLWAHAQASYRKADYQLHPDRIVIRGGGLFSNAELEVHYPNVTLVRWVRPWLSHKLFGVGHVYVEVAGSAAGSIAFYCITGSDGLQAELRCLLEQEFSMSTDELLHEESPSGLAIVLDIILKGSWTMIGTVMVIGLEALPLFAELAESDRAWRPAHLLWLLLGIPILGLMLGVAVLHFLDLKRRIYRVYNGVIEYHEGFLTRCNSFMPVENLSDSEVTRGIVQRLARAYNVVVSCQGAGQEVTFLHLMRGPELGAVLDSLIKGSPAPVSRMPAPEPQDGELPAAMPPPLPVVAAPELTYRMHRGRSLLPMVPVLVIVIPLLFVVPLMAIFLWSVAVQLARIFRTTYRLRDNSVGENFEFIQVTQREFSMDKITGVVFRENILDQMLNTMTIQFWSIGAGKEIAFRNVRKDDALIAAVRERAKINFDSPTQTIPAQHSLRHFLGANLIGLLFAATVTAGVAVTGFYLHWGYALIAIPFVLIPLIAFIWGAIHYPRAQLEFHDEGMIFRRGIITQQQTYARYQNIKDITTTKFPGSDCGSMRFNVAGERVLQKGATSIPYGFTMHYITELLSKNQSFDYDILPEPGAFGTTRRGRPREPEQAIAEQEIIEARKALGNTAVRTIITSFILLPLAVLLPITLPIALWRASLVRYRIEPGRILMRKGRLFLSQTSILFSRIDHIQTSEGMLNKLFKNGDIRISTAGSSSAELVLGDLKDHESFYKALREVHRQQHGEE